MIGLLIGGRSIDGPRTACRGTGIALPTFVARRRPIMERKVDKTKVDPLTGGEEPKPAAPLETVPEGQPANATTAVIPGTGRPVQDGDREKRVVNT
jgi:hypothetical protein